MGRDQVVAPCPVRELEMQSLDDRICSRAFYQLRAFAEAARDLWSKDIERRHRGKRSHHAVANRAAMTPEEPSERWCVAALGVYVVPGSLRLRPAGIENR